MVLLRMAIKFAMTKSIKATHNMFGSRTAQAKITSSALLPSYVDLCEVVGQLIANK